MLTGQAKTDYQRGYMRRRRAKAVLDPLGIPLETLDPMVNSVRPKPKSKVVPVRPDNVSDSQWNYILHQKGLI